MLCLYAADYGPPDPSFDPFAVAGPLSALQQAHRAEIAAARNLGQLEAIKRKIAKGEQVVWCEQGYGWTHDAPIEGFFSVVTVLVLPYALFRLLRRFGFVVRRGRRAARAAS
jgi:hypothetical protein